MKNDIFIVLCLFVLTVYFGGTARAEELKEGKWSMTMTTKLDSLSPEMANSMREVQEQMANNPQLQGMGIHMGLDGQGMTTTVTHCVSKQNPVPRYSKEDQDDCQHTNDISGNKVHFHTVCNRDDMQMDATGEMTYTGDSMEGHIKSHMVKAGRSMNSVVDITGQYIGPCS